MRLALQKGDTLKIRFVNRLPKVNPLKLNHINDEGQANLFLNPTNVHTHGLIVPARAATRADPTWGDNVFVTVYNAQCFRLRDGKRLFDAAAMEINRNAIVILFRQKDLAFARKENA